MNIKGTHILSFLKIIGIMTLIASIILLNKKNYYKNKDGLKDFFETKNINYIQDNPTEIKFKSANLSEHNVLYPIDSLDVDYGNKMENTTYCHRFIESP